MKKVFSLTVMVLLCTGTYSQNLYHIVQKDSTQREKKSLLCVGLETSTTAYINRETNDSNSTQLYVGAYADYYHQSGLGIMLKTYILPGGSNPGFYLTTISPYYGKFTGKVIPYISYTRMIYHDNPAVPSSPIQNEIYGSVRLKTRIVDPIAGVDWGFGEDQTYGAGLINDFIVYIAASHIFDIPDVGKNANLAIIPSVQLNAGTDRYFKYMQVTKYISQGNGYNNLVRGRGRRYMGGGTMTTTEGMISQNNEFALSSFVVYLGTLYFIGDFSIEPAGCVYFPIRGDNNVNGYWQLNLNYFF